MFWMFKGKRDGLDDQGRSYDQALVDHISWCMEVLSSPSEDDDDGVLAMNALGELTNHYHEFINSLNPEISKIVKKSMDEFLELLYKKPIEEILEERQKRPTPLYKADHKWEWMPINKREAEEIYKKQMRTEEESKRKREEVMKNGGLSKLLEKSSE